MKKELSYLETITMISEVKKIFERKFEKGLDLIKVPCPLFVKTSSGLQDALTGVEESVSFMKGDEKFEIVHSLAKWKREALGKYGLPVHKGIYTDMKAIRKDEFVDDIHSLYVEQYDWEKVILKSDRTIPYLKDTVRSIYKVIKDTMKVMHKKYSCLSYDLPRSVYFITSQELESLYPTLTPKEREQAICRKYKAVFIIGIGDKLLSGTEHDLRSPDYDDWSLDGDLIVYFKELDKCVELSSMGIRVDEKSLKSQLEKKGELDKLKLPYHKKIMEASLPYSIGGGIGVSRILMLLLGKKHISEVQASSWEEKTYKELEKVQML